MCLTGLPLSFMVVHGSCRTSTLCHLVSLRVLSLLSLLTGWNQSLTLNRIDYCKVAFAGLLQRSIIRLQAVIQSAMNATDCSWILPSLNSSGVRHHARSKDWIAALSPLVRMLSSLRSRSAISVSFLTETYPCRHMSRDCEDQLCHPKTVEVCLSVTQDVTCHLVQSLTLNRIGYCNVASAGLLQRSIIRLQAVINAAARLVLRVKKFDHISTAIQDELDWFGFRRLFEMR